jgi:hypothetical protein
MVLCNLAQPQMSMQIAYPPVLQVYSLEPHHTDSNMWS